MSEGKYKYLVKNTVLFTISSFGSKILTFLLVPLYTSVLKTSEYGTVDLIITIATLLISVFTLNISDAVLRFAIERKERQDEILSYGLQILLKGTFFFAVLLIVAYLMHLVNWKSYCYVFLFLYFFSTALYQLLSGYLRALDKVVIVAVSGIVVTSITIISNILLLLLARWGLIGYMISIIAGNFGASLYCVFYLDYSWKSVIKKCDVHVQKEMKKYSIPLIFNGVAWWMNSSIDKFFITWICGIEMNGIYAVSTKIPTILTTFNNIFAQAWNLSAIKEFDKDDKDGFFTKIYNTYNSCLVILCSALIIINIWLAKLLFAKDFFEGWKYSSFLLISVVFSALSSFVGCIFSASKDSRVFAISTVVSAIINIVLNAMLISLWGALGAAVATAICFFAIWQIRMICARKYIRWKTNMVRDYLAYALLVLQVVLEHMAGHMYLGQTAIFIVLILMYRKYFVDILKKMYSIVKQKVMKK